MEATMKLYRTDVSESADIRDIIQHLRGVVPNTHGSVFVPHLMNGGKVELSGCEWHRLLDYASAWLRSQ